MSVCPAKIASVPVATVQVASAAFPKGCPVMLMRDELGMAHDDQMFAAVYPDCGQPAHPAWHLALVTVLQSADSLADQQAANAAQGRTNRKYALGLELADPEFDCSILYEFRVYLIAGDVERILLNAMLARCCGLGLLKAHGRRRTCRTCLLAPVRTLNWRERVGEPLRAAWHALAGAAPDRLMQHGRIATAGVEEWRLPKGEAP